MKVSRKPFACFWFLILFTSMVWARIIHFAGVDWYVKNGGPYGPGPNYWSDNEQSVWLDAQGRLHLTIRQENGIWYCSEVYTVKETTYGQHRFLVEGWIDRMDRNMVLGLFVYATDTSEIDIEFSKWGDPLREQVASFTVQPYWEQGNQQLFECQLDSTPTTHFFDWQPGFVHFGSMRGHYYAAPPSESYYFSRWLYNGDNIPTSDMRLHTHINFWLMNGNAPQDLSVNEIIITDVQQPLQTGALENYGSVHIVLEGLQLEQNFPNPFNDRTVIFYRLQCPNNKPLPVSLTLFDCQGRVIKHILEGSKVSGKYSINLQTKEFPSGIYFYLLTAGPFQKTKKMLFVK